MDSVPRAPSKTDLLVGLFRQAIRKRVWNLDCKQACPPSSSPLFLARFTGAITRCVIGLLPACVVAPAGERRFAAAKRARQPQLAFPNPLVFSAEKTATLAYTSTKRQSAERSSASVRSTPKKKPEKNRGKLACIRFLRFFFNTDCRANNAANFQCQNAGSLVLS